jgi:K+ transporter
MVAFFYHFGTGVGAPHSFTALARRTLVLPRIVIFLSVQIQAVPYMDERDRISVTKLRGLDGFYVLSLRLGYRDKVDVRHRSAKDLPLDFAGSTSAKAGDGADHRSRTRRNIP